MLTDPVVRGIVCLLLYQGEGRWDGFVCPNDPRCVCFPEDGVDPLCLTPYIETKCDGLIEVAEVSFVHVPRAKKNTFCGGGGLQPSDLANFVYGLNRNDTTDPAAKTPPVVLVKGPPGPQAKKKKKNPERGLCFSFV
jgi:hypothetical protein